MNIQNIASLTDKLVTLGFDESIGYRLLQHICFKPVDFTLIERIRKGKDVLACSIFFEKKGDEYICSYYDAAFLKEMEMPDLLIHSVNIRELDQRMVETDWQGINKQAAVFSLENEGTWEREKRIEKIVMDLSRLSVTEEGKNFADCLKVKHWSGIHMNATMGNLNVVKSRFELIQRFYFFDGQSISIEEAYRFLLNRWLEKKLLTKRKQEVNPIPDDAAESGVAGGDKSLLQKKRKTKANKLKR